MAVETEQSIEFSPELQAYIREWKGKPGSLIMILHKVQQELGYIPREAAFEVSRLVDVPLAKIYGVATFYHYFKLTEPGRNSVSVCMGTACYLRGGEDIVSELESLLGIPVGSTTEDGEFSIEAVRCVGCCGLAPVVVIGDEVYGKVTKDKLPEILAKHRGA